MELDHLQLKLCDIQGRLFELSLDAGFGSQLFIKSFMNSRTAACLDSTYNRMQWAGEEYLLEEVEDEAGEALVRQAEQYPREMMYWIGYLYRYWHYYTGESSKKIYRQATAATMKRNYLMFHTMAPELAVDDLKEIHMQKKQKSK